MSRGFGERKTSRRVLSTSHELDEARNDALIRQALHPVASTFAEVDQAETQSGRHRVRLAVLRLDVGDRRFLRTDLVQHALGCPSMVAAQEDKTHGKQTGRLCDDGQVQRRRACRQERRELHADQMPRGRVRCAKRGDGHAKQESDGQEVVAHLEVSEDVYRRQGRQLLHQAQSIQETSVARRHLLAEVSKDPLGVDLDISSHVELQHRRHPVVELGPIEPGHVHLGIRLDRHATRPHLDSKTDGRDAPPMCGQERPRSHEQHRPAGDNALVRSPTAATAAECCSLIDASVWFSFSVT